MGIERSFPLKFFAKCSVINFSQSLLSCGMHSCPSKCHQLYDHSKMKCEYIVQKNCSKGHDQGYACHEGPQPSCKKCDQQAKLAEKKRQEALESQRKRDAEEQKHLRRMADIDAEIDLERQKIADARLKEEREKSISQKNSDLENIKSRVAGTISSFTGSTVSQSKSHAVTNKTELSTNQSHSVHKDLKSPRTSARQTSIACGCLISPSQEEWRRQKQFDGAINDHVDNIMDMVGLESVKSKVLDIKDRVETSKRQNTLLNRVRFNAVFLGNPGTGMSQFN